MHSHATMNRIYRLIWSEVLGAWVAVAEHSRARGKGAARKMALAALLASSMVWAAPPAATQTPTGAQVIAGTVTVQQNNAHTEVTQASQRGIVEWQSFNVGSHASVNFAQPSASAVTLNRVLDTQASQVFGKITANGQVFLVNPSGVVFAPGASVEVGGLVGTTHSISNSDFLNGNYHFTRNGATSSVVNEGSLKASVGGYIALLAPEVRNSGVVLAQAGTVALAAGEAMTLHIQGANGLADVIVEPSALNALVENREAVRAPGGQIILSAQAANSLLGGVIKNSGTLEATGVLSEGGRVRLAASDRISHTGSIRADAASDSSGNGGSVTLIASLDNAASTTVFDGTISARGGALGGNGGFVETSANKLIVGDRAQVDTSAARGATGMWLLDPTDYKIAENGGDVTGRTLSANLQNNNVTLLSSQGNSGSNGDIIVDDFISWNSANTLTLMASRNVEVMHPIKNFGNGKLVLRADSGGTCVAGAGICGIVNFGDDGVINMSSTLIYTNAPGSNNKADPNGGGPIYSNAPNYSNKVMTGILSTYMLVNDVNQLQAINTNLNGNYALGRNIDASGASAWSSGFSPIGLTSNSGFTGNFDGLGNTISNIKIDLGSATNVGLISTIGSTGTVRNLGLVGGSINGKMNTGALAGANNGTIASSYSSAEVKTTVTAATNTGGLVGINSGNINTSYASGSISGFDNVGGLVGLNQGNLSNSYAVGNVRGNNVVGGLIGYNNGAVINSFSTGAPTLAGATANAMAGGLIGFQNTSANASFWDMTTSGQSRATGNSNNASGITGKTTADMKLKATFTGANWDFATPIWVVNGVTNNGYPYLNGVYVPITDSVIRVAVTNTQASSMYGDPVANFSTALYIGTTQLDAATLNSLGLIVTGTASLNDAPGTNAVPGIYKPSYNSGFTLGGTNGASYSMVADTPALYSVSKRPLTLAATRTYDSSTNIDNGILIATNLVGNDCSSGLIACGLGGTTTALNANVVSRALNPLNLNTLILSNLLDSRYTLSGASGTAGIMAKALTVTGMTASNKTYDGNVRATFADGTLSGLVGDEKLAFTPSGNFADKNVAEDIAVTVTGIALANDTGLAANYTVSNPTGLTASIMAKVLSVTGMTASDKVYDGSTMAALSGGTLDGVVKGESLNFTGASGAFDTKNAGSGKAVTVTGIALDDGGTGQAHNYTVSNPTGLTASIMAKALTVTGMTASDKVYDGSTIAVLSGGALGGVIKGESLNFAGASGAFDTKNAGSGKAVTVTGIALDDGGTGQALNYTVSNPTGLTASITAKALTVIGMTASDKTYDGSVRATLNGGTLSGLVDDEKLSFTSSGNFADKNAAKDIAVTVTGIALADDTGLATNYTVSNPTGLTASITAKALTVSGMTATDKVYDGSTVAALSGGTLDGVVKGESLNFTGASGAFDTKNAGSGKAVTVTGLALDDGGTGQANNYTVSNPTGLTASIMAKALTVTGMTASDKTYDGLTVAALSGGALNGVVKGESLNFTGASGAFENKNAGSGKAVTVTGIALDDGGTGEALNYTVSNPTGLTASIMAKALTVTGMTASDKIYDGSTVAALSGGALDGVIKGESLNFTGASGAFDTKNAGSGKAVTVTGIALDDGGTGQAHNYTVSNPTGLTASIMAKALSVTGMTASDKVYDGSTIAVLSGGALDGVIKGESLNFTGASGAFDTKNAGSGKAVTVAGLTLDDGGTGEALNYTVSNPTGLTASITAKALSVTGMTASDKVYDGSTVAVLSGGALYGVVNGESLNFTGTSGAFDTKNAGSGKAVTVTGIALDDGGTGQAHNYTVSNPTGLTASIMAKALSVTGMTASDKVYDGSTIAVLSGGALDGVIKGESLNFAGASGAFDTKNAGSGKAVTVTGLTLDDGGTGEALNYTVSNPTGLTASITAKALSVTGMTASDKVYDGNVRTTFAGGTLSGLVNDETLGFTSSGNFADKNVAKDIAVTVTGIALADDTGLAANYTVSNPTGLTAGIMAKALSVTGMTASDKTYDGSTVAALSGGVLDGVVKGESLNFTGASGAFDTKNAGSGKAVTVTGLTLDDGGTGDAINYTISNPAGLKADIGRLDLPVQGVQIANKVYDGNVTANIMASGTISALKGDKVLLNPATATAYFADSGVSLDKPVIVSGYTISGADVANYRLLQPGTLSADITPQSLPVVMSAALPVMCTNYAMLPPVDPVTGEYLNLSSIATASDVANGLSAASKTDKWKSELDCQ
jgi:filamentous hemagglutinin family protein